MSNPVSDMKLVLDYDQMYELVADALGSVISTSYREQRILVDYIKASDIGSEDIPDEYTISFRIIEQEENDG